MCIVKGRLIAQPNRQQLVCALGEFYVEKDARLTVVDGVHDGFFELKAIRPGVLHQEDGQSLLIQTVRLVGGVLCPSGHSNASEKPAATVKASLPGEAAVSLQEEDMQQIKHIFGDNWPLGSQVSLDASLSRDVLQQQVSYLKSKGYRLDTAKQVWHCE